MPPDNTIKFISNPLLQNADERYMTILVHVPIILESWRHSVFSYEWLRPDGGIKSIEELSENEKPKRASVETALQNHAPVAQAVLGIGIMENVEFGMGRAEFLTLAAHGFTRMPVHIPKSNESDFKAFRADINL